MNIINYNIHTTFISIFIIQLFYIFLKKEKKYILNCTYIIKANKSIFTIKILQINVKT